MNVKPFIDFNSHCPLCGNKLSLYLDFVDDKERFKSFMRKDKICFHAVREFKQYFFNIAPNGDVKSNFKSNGEFCLFYLCNTEAIINNDINPNVTCYYRSSPTMKIENGDIVHARAGKPLVNKSEYFILDQDVKGIKNFYILSFLFEENESGIHHYLENSKDTLFSQTFDFILDRPDFSQRKELMKKIHRWMYFS